MQKSNILIHKDSEKLVESFTRYFMDLLNKTVGSMNVALSGGSTPKIWFDHLAKKHKEDIDWDRVQIYWGDERCVPPSDNESNYGMTKKYLLDHINIPVQNVRRILGELKPDVAAKKYSHVLSKNLSGKSFPIFDLVVLGMGDDGHTASIFPHQIDLWKNERYCVVATHPITGQQRISLSGSVINAACSIAFLVTGINKAEKVMEILNIAEGAEKYPASLVRKSDNVFWFLDKLAASRL